MRTKKIADTKRTNPRAPILSRLFSKCELNPVSGCWEWSASVRGGYGTLAVLDKNRKRGLRTDRAHRLSWEAFNGPIPKGLYALHKCDNRPCINPTHLFLGTNLDNVADSIAKRRWPVRSGNDCGRAKLSPDEVKTARKLRRDGVSAIALAKKYGVNKTTMHRLINGETWKNL